MSQESSNVTKIYDIKMLNVGTAKDDLRDIRDLFNEIREAKLAANDAKASGDTAAQDKMNASLKQLVDLQKQMLNATKDRIAQSKESATLVNKEAAAHADLGEEMRNTGNIGKAAADKITESMGKMNRTVLETVSGYIVFEKAVNSADIAQAHNVETLVIARQELDRVKAKFKEAAESFKAGKISGEEYFKMIGALTKQQLDLNYEISQTTAAIKSQIKAQEAEDGSINAARASLALLTAERNRLNLTTEEGIQLNAQYNAQIDELQAFINKHGDKNLQRKNNIGNYAEGVAEGVKPLGAQLKEVNMQLQQMVANGEKGSAEFEALKVKAIELKSELRQLNDETGKQTSLTEKLTAKMESMGLRLIANLVVMQAAFELFEVTKDRITEIIDRMNLAENTLIAVNSKAAESYAQVAINIKFMRDAFESATATETEKKEIVEQLNEKYETQIGHLNGIADAERFFKDKSGAFIEAMKLRSEATAAASVAAEKLIEYEKTLASGGKDKLDFFDYFGVLASPIGPKGYLELRKKTYVQQAKDDADQVEKITDDLFKKYEEQAAALDKKYGFDTGKTKKDKKPKKVKQPFDLTNATLTNDENLLKFQADEIKEEIQQRLDANAQIFGYEKASMQDRLDAYKKFYDDSLLLLENERDTATAEVQVKLDKISQIEHKDATKRTGEEKTLLAQKSSLEEHLYLIQEQFVTKSQQLQYTAAKDRLAIVRSAFDNELKDIDQTTTQRLSDLLASVEQKYNDIIKSHGFQGDKQRALGKLDNQQGIATDQIDIAGNKEKEDAIAAEASKEVLSYNYNNVADYYAQLAQLRQKDFQDQKDINARKLKDEQDKARQRQEIIDGISVIVEQGAKSYVENAQKEIDINYQNSEAVLNSNKTIALARAQSSQQQLAIQKQFDLAQMNLNRDKMRQEKKLKEEQLTIEFAVAEMKAISNALDTPGIGVLEAIVSEGELAAVYATNLALLESTNFGRGGDLLKIFQQYANGGDPLEVGGVFGGRSHANGGNKYMLKHGGQVKYVETEHSEISVINARSANSNALLNVSGTPKQIASAVNSFGGGVNFAPGASMQRFEYGGSLGNSLRAPSFTNTYHSGSVYANAQHGGAMALLADGINTAHSRIDTLKVMLDPHDLSRFNNKQAKRVQRSTL